MSGLFGIELDNPTGNTVVVDLFQLGSEASFVSSQIVVSEVKESYVPITDGGITSTNAFFFSGNTTKMTTNPNVYYKVDNKDVGLSIATSTSLNPAFGKRNIITDSAITIALASANPLNLEGLKSSAETSYISVVSATFNVIVNPIAELRYDDTLSKFQLKLKFQVIYQTQNESSVIDPIQFFEFQTNSQFVNFRLPTSSLSGFSPENWSTSYTNINGVIVKGTTGDDYGQLLRGQSGEPMAINSMRVTPLSSSTFDESNRISQLLQPMKFTRVNSNGLSDSYVLSPTVDLYQAMTTLDYINLGTRTDDFPFDGNTIFSYQLLPFARVNLQFDYIQISNFIFANRELVKEIVERNKQRNKEVEYLSSISREYKLKLK